MQPNDNSIFLSTFDGYAELTSDFYKKQCCLYFPVNRFEEPAWLNVDNLKSKANYSELKHISGYSNRNIICTSPLKNNKNWLLDLIFDRQTFEIQTLDRQQYFERIATILVSEGIDLNENNLVTLDDYVDAAYPDLRKCINMLQQNCVDGQLQSPSTDTVSGNSEYVVAAVGLFKEGRITEARKLLAGKLQPNDYEEFYRLLYRNLDWWGNTDRHQNSAIVVIANRLRDHSIAADPEINAAACMVELSMIREG